MSNGDMWPEQGKPLEIIDFATKGNVFKFFLGFNGKQWGDDWNDAPYEHNAGEVYHEYVDGTAEFAVSFDAGVFEPCDGHLNSEWTKEDMIKRRVPCLIIVPSEADVEVGGIYDFEQALVNENTIKVYFGDTIDSVRRELANL